MIESPSAQRAAARKRKQDREDGAAVLRELLSTVRGRRWLWLRMEECHAFADDENLDHAVMAYQKGQRNIGLRLISATMAASPALYLRMTEENTQVVLTDPNQPDEEDSDAS